MGVIVRALLSGVKFWRLPYASASISMFMFFVSVAMSLSTSSPQLPFKIPQIPSNRGTLGV